MSIYYMPSTVLGVGDTVDVETGKVLVSMEHIFLAGEGEATN